MKRFMSLALLALAAGSAVFAAEEVKTLAIGAAAPDFNLTGVDGRRYTLKDFADAKVLVLVFTANHCPTAQAYEERIKQIAADHKDKGVQVVAISSNDPQALRLNEMGYTDVGDTFEDMKLRAKDQNFAFPYLYDGDTQEVARAYGPVATPHVFVFDAERKLRYVGRIDNAERLRAVKTNDLRNALDALLAGRPVPVEVTKPFGCSLKWAEKREDVKRYMDQLAAQEVTVKKISPDELKAILANRSDKVRLVNVWATWCPPCVREFPDLVTIHRMYGHRPFELITVSADMPDQEKEVIAFLKKHQAAGTNYLFDSEDRDALVQVLGKDWPGAIPYSLLIRPGGEVALKVVGLIDPLEMKRAIVKEIGRTY